MSKLRLFLCLLTFHAGCNFVRVEDPAPPATPADEAFATATAPAPAPPTSTSTPAIEVAVESPTPRPDPTAILPSPTPGPWQHVVREGETLGFIVQRYGYRNFDVIDVIVQLNDNVPNANLLPGEGSVILIPRPTATPLPADFTPLPVPPALIDRLAPTSPATGLNYDTAIAEHVVVQGQTVVDIFVQHDTTLEIISILNPDISFARCDFSLRSGGPECNPLLNVGQIVRVPAPTPSPTLSPTFSGRETATPTPTWPAPQVVYPAQGAVMPPQAFRLHWLSVGALQAGEVYLVQISDASGVLHNEVTRDTSLMLPPSLVPTNGAPADLTWTVSVARADANEVYRIISGYPQVRRFRWRAG